MNKHHLRIVVIKKLAPFSIYIYPTLPPMGDDKDLFDDTAWIKISPNGAKLHYTMHYRAALEAAGKHIGPKGM
jgi:hypothetical protein